MIPRTHDTTKLICRRYHYDAYAARRFTLMAARDTLCFYVSAMPCSLSHAALLRYAHAFDLRAAAARLLPRATPRHLYAPREIFVHAC